MAARKQRRDPRAKTSSKPGRTLFSGGRGSRSALRRSGRARPAKAERAAATRTRALRLPPDVRPVAYDLRVEVDPASGDAFRGTVAIRLRLERARRALELHAADLSLANARVEAGGGERPAGLRLRPATESVEIRLAQAVPAGEVVLRLDFSGELRGDLRGLYRAASGERRYAFTQLEAADARRFFPCFDEPAFKSRFTLHVTTAKRHTVLSNSPALREEPLDSGRKTVHFAETPPLSTYLVALCVGELEGSPPEHVGPTPIRVWHVPGKSHLTAFALEAARESLLRLERYFDLPYPYAKLDLVAAPDFEAGAMENAGCVLFRETLLLADPASASLAEKKRVAEVICHELAHMWYGDLVTMAWWNDLWLNEAFATWMAFTIVDQWRPDWKLWLDFEHHRSAALGLDALDHTHPIYVEVRTPADATQNFDLITYEKGASVVRMIERYLGAEAFRAGVRLYIRRHREANAVASDLWNALAEAAGEPVEPVVRAWIERPGFPLLAVRRTPRGDALELRQERFFARPGRRAAARWPVPWVARIGEATGGVRLERRLLRRARERIELGGAARFVHANADEGGFFRPHHDARELAALAGALPELTAVERMGLVSHQWALVRAGRAPIASFLDLADAFGDEREPEVLVALRGALAFVEEQLAPAAGGDTSARLHDWLATRFSSQLAKLGWDAAPGDDDDTRLRRAAVIGLLGEVAERPAVLAEAARRFTRYLADRSTLEPNLASTVVLQAARTADASRFDALLQAMRAARTPQERQRFLLALAECRDPALVERALALPLSEEVATQDVAILLARLLGNRAARERTWSFVKRRWAALRRRMPPMLASRVVEATPALQTAAWRRDVAAFFRAHPGPTAARALRQALERFALNAELRRREAPGLARWLAARNA